MLGSRGAPSLTSFSVGVGPLDTALLTDWTHDRAGDVSQTWFFLKFRLC